jgi:hypothetical protein
MLSPAAFAQSTAASVQHLQPTQDDPIKFNHGWNFNWYVDSNGGSDSNSGTSYGAPLKTIAAWTAKNPAAGQSTGLRSNSQWREQLVANNNNMSFAAYDPGAKPWLIGSDIILPAAWSVYSGNCYQAAETSGGSGTTEIWVWENNIRLTRESSAAGCVSTPGSYYIANEGTANPTVYVQASDSTNPGSNGKTYEYSSRANGINVGGANGKIYDIHASRSNGNDGPISMGNSVGVPGSIIIDALSEESYSHLYYIQYNSAIINSVARDGGSMFVLHDPGSHNGTWYMLNDTAYDDDPYDISQGSGFISHNGGEGPIGTEIINNFTVHDAASAGGISYTDSTGTSTLIYLNSPNFYNVGGGFGTAQGTMYVTGGTVDLSNTFGDDRLFEAGNNGPNVSIYISGITSSSSVPDSLLYFGYSGDSATLTNNTITDSTSTGGFEVNGSGSSFTETGDIINGIATGSTEYSLAGVATSSLSLDYNSYNTENFSTVVGGTTYATLPTLQALLPQQAHSTPAPLANLIPSPKNTDMTQTGWGTGGLSAVTANSIRENTQNTRHGVQYPCNTACGEYPSGLYTFSIEAKWGGGTMHNWMYVSSNDGAFNPGVYFDTENLVVGTTTGAIVGTPVIVNCGNASAKCSQVDSNYNRFYFSAYGGLNTAANALYVGLASANGVYSYTGDGTSTLYVRQAKISEGGSPL